MGKKEYPHQLVTPIALGPPNSILGTREDQAKEEWKLLIPGTSLEIIHTAGQILIKLKPFKHIQGSSASTWQIDHNLHYRPTTFSLWIGVKCAFSFVVEHVNDDRLYVKFGAAYAGEFQCF